MSEQNDGGPAFPHLNPNFDGNWDKEPQRAGMSLRDYFAAKAMQAVLQDCLNAGDSESDMARLAYKVADAMLEQRKL